MEDHQIIVLENINNPIIKLQKAIQLLSKKDQLLDKMKKFAVKKTLPYGFDDNDINQMANILQ